MKITNIWQMPDGIVCIEAEKTKKIKDLLSWYNNEKEILILQVSMGTGKTVENVKNLIDALTLIINTK